MTSIAAREKCAFAFWNGAIKEWGFLSLIWMLLGAVLYIRIKEETSTNPKMLKWNGAAMILIQRAEAARVAISSSASQLKVLAADLRDAVSLVFITLRTGRCSGVFSSFMDSALASFLCWLPELIAGQCVLCARSHIGIRIVGIWLHSSFPFAVIFSHKWSLSSCLSVEQR